MPLFDQWPYTDFSKLNLDWVLKVIKKAENVLNGIDTNIQQAVNAWMNAHPEATTTVQDHSITKVKLAASLTDEITFRNDINKEFTPEQAKIGMFTHATAQIQGMTTDGSWLYAAGTDGDTSNVVIYVMDPTTLQIQGMPHVLANTYGHPNSMDYCAGKLYIAGTLSSPGSADYQHMTIVTVSDWSQTTVDLPQGIKLWSIAMLRAYNGKYVMAGHSAESGQLSLFATIYMEQGGTFGLNKFLPWRNLDIGPFSCDPAGMCQYGKYILIGDAHLTTSYANNAVRIFDSDGGFKANVYLPVMGTNELEDICCIGSLMFITDISGNIYRADLSRILNINYDPTMFSQNNAPGIQYIYINENGSEHYAPAGSNGALLMDQFRVIPWFFPSKHWILDGSMVVRTQQYDRIMLKPCYEGDGSITFQGSGASGYALCSIWLKYTRTSRTDEYEYNLTDFRLTAHYEDQRVIYDNLADAAAAGYFYGYSYIRELTAEAGPRFTTTTITC